MNTNLEFIFPSYVLGASLGRCWARRQLVRPPGAPPASLGLARTAGLLESPLRPLGQVMDGYLVAECEEGLVLVDQHAAHERVLYNRFLARLEARSLALLLPETLDLDPVQVAAAADHRERLRALGFEVEEFGPRALRVTAAP